MSLPVGRWLAALARVFDRVSTACSTVQAQPVEHSPCNKGQWLNSKPVLFATEEHPKRGFWEEDACLPEGSSLS
jgi:hypothetical protein